MFTDHETQSIEREGIIARTGSGSSVFQAEKAKQCAPGYEEQFNDRDNKGQLLHVKSDASERNKCAYLREADVHEKAVAERTDALRQKAVAARTDVLGHWAVDNSADPDEVDAAVSELYHAMAGSGNRKVAILHALTGRSPAEIVAIRKQYNESARRVFGPKTPLRNFDEEIRAALSDDAGALAEAEAYITGKPVAAANAAIQNAMGLLIRDGDKQKIFATLERLTREQLVELQRQTHVLTMITRRLSGDERELALALLAGDRGRAEALKFRIAANKSDKRAMLAVLRKAAQNELDHEDLLIQYRELGEEFGTGVKHYIPDIDKDPQPRAGESETDASYRVHDENLKLRMRAEATTLPEIYRMQSGALGLLRSSQFEFSGHNMEEATALIGSGAASIYAQRAANSPIRAHREEAAQAAIAEAKSSWFGKDRKVLEAKEQYDKLTGDEEAELAAMRIHDAIHIFEMANPAQIFAALRTVKEPAQRGKIKDKYQRLYGKSLDTILKDKLETYDEDVAHRILGDKKR